MTRLRPLSIAIDLADIAVLPVSSEGFATGRVRRSEITRWNSTTTSLPGCRRIRAFISSKATTRSADEEVDANGVSAIGWG